MKSLSVSRAGVYFAGESPDLLGTRFGAAAVGNPSTGVHQPKVKKSGRVVSDLERVMLEGLRNLELRAVPSHSRTQPLTAKEKHRPPKPDLDIEEEKVAPVRLRRALKPKVPRTLRT